MVVFQVSQINKHRTKQTKHINDVLLPKPDDMTACCANKVFTMVLNTGQGWGKYRGAPGIEERTWLGANSSSASANTLSLCLSVFSI